MKIGNATDYVPPKLAFLTLQVPQPKIRVEHQVPAPLGEVLEGDLASHPLVGRPTPAQRMSSGTDRVPFHCEIKVLARLLQAQQPREDRGVTSGGPAAGIVASHVAWDAAG